MLLLLLLFLSAVAALAAPEEAARPAPAAGPLVWNTLTNFYTAKPGDISAHIAFYATNVSTMEVVVDSLKPSCGCTVPQMPSTPWRLQPGESGRIDLTVDLREGSGRLFKNVNVLSTSAPTILFIELTVPPAGTNALKPEVAERLWNQEVARTDRQAVFKQDCVKCHLVPAFGKSGEALYKVACGICHDSTQRAAFVPDLSALKLETGTNYWRTMVAHGKEGTLMPGSAATDGGPLDEPQMDSLVNYLLDKYPPRSQSAKPVDEKK